MVTKIMKKLNNIGSKGMLVFVVDFNQILYGSGDARTTENRCFVYTKQHFPTKAPIGFNVEFYVKRKETCRRAAERCAMVL